jgi:hypothetical protein
VAKALKQHRDRQAVEAEAGGWADRELVFATPRGTAIDPRNFTRMFGELCDRAGVRRVRLHDLRHTCVTLLMQLGVPPRVVMEIVDVAVSDCCQKQISTPAAGERAGQPGAPPGTRTPNPRIKSPNPVMSSWFGWCRPVPFPQASDEPLCRPVSAQTGHLPGPRAPMEHRDGSWCSIDGQGGGAVERLNQRTFDPLAVDHAPSEGAIAASDRRSRAP